MVNKLIKKIILGCGCKNKNGASTNNVASTQQPQQQQPQPVVQNTSVQENVKKVVEKYYKK